jgi:beta-lactamase regulating signal transducer with metallopeptidase domain
MKPLADHIWQSTLFAGILALVVWTLRRSRARVRHGLWMAGLAKFLLPFSALIAIGAHLPWRTSVHLAAPSISPAVLAVSEPFAAPAGIASAPTPSLLPAILLLTWLCGLAAIAGSWWVRWRRIAAAVRDGAPVDRQFAIRAVSCSAMVEPGVFGILRPVLLLPAGIFERLTAEQLETVIAHELYHVRHRDNLWATFQMLVETVFWFHPLVWWIGRRMVEKRERACDEAVLRAGGEPRIYAEAILSVCKFYTEAPVACVSGVTGANLKRRIEAIMSKNIGREMRPAQKLGLAIASLAAITVPITIGMLHSPTVRAQAQSLAPVSPAEQQRRTEFARANYRNASMVRTYVAYGPPDRVEDRTSDPQHPSQIWHYNYLPDFQHSAEFEFAPPDRGSRMRVNWPPPLATFIVDPRSDARWQLPRQASVAVYTSKQDVTVTVPLDSFSGQVDIIGTVAANGQKVAHVRDRANAGPGAQAEWRAGFTLGPGSYSCGLFVREVSSDRMYIEQIPFEITK